MCQRLCPRDQSISCRNSLSLPVRACSRAVLGLPMPRSASCWGPEQSSERNLVLVLWLMLPLETKCWLFIAWSSLCFGFLGHISHAPLRGSPPCRQRPLQHIPTALPVVLGVASAARTCNLGICVPPSPHHHLRALQPTSGVAWLLRPGRREIIVLSSFLSVFPDEMEGKFLVSLPTQ